MSLDNPLSQALLELQRGRKIKARQILAQTIQQEPRNEKAWFLLSEIVEDKQQVVQCLERVIRLNPSHAIATQKLWQLKSEQRTARAQDRHDLLMPSPSLESGHAAIIPISPSTETKPAITTNKQFQPFWLMTMLVGILSFGACICWILLAMIPKPATTLSPLSADELLGDNWHGKLDCFVCKEGVPMAEDLAQLKEYHRYDESGLPEKAREFAAGGQIIFVENGTDFEYIESQKDNPSGWRRVKLLTGKYMGRILWVAAVFALPPEIQR